MSRITHQPRRISSRKLAAALILGCLSATSYAQACEEPAFDQSMPDGKTASEADMTAAQQAVKDFVAQGEAYIACLEDDGSLTSTARDRRRGSTIDEMQVVAANFNRELRHYRKR